MSTSSPSMPENLLRSGVQLSESLRFLGSMEWLAWKLSLTSQHYMLSRSSRRTSQYYMLSRALRGRQALRQCMNIFQAWLSFICMEGRKIIIIINYFQEIDIGSYNSQRTSRLLSNKMNQINWYLLRRKLSRPSLRLGVKDKDDLIREVQALACCQCVTAVATASGTEAKKR